MALDTRLYGMEVFITISLQSFVMMKRFQNSGKKWHDVHILRVQVPWEQEDHPFSRTY